MESSRRPEGRVCVAFALGLAVLTVAGSPARAQQQPAAAPAPTPAGTFISRETVSVTNVDVIVEDGKGNRVTGLRREDFTVLEDGMEQPVTNFFAVEQGRVTVLGDEAIPPAPPTPPGPASQAAPPAAPVPTPRTRLVIFVDNLSLSPFNRNRVLRNVEDWVRTTVKENVEGMIVVWNRSLKIRRKFTNDGRDLSDVLKQIEEEATQGQTRNSSLRDLLERFDDMRSAAEAIGAGRQWALEQSSDLVFTLDALKSTITQLSGVEGRKILLYVGEGLPQSPGAEVWKYIQDKWHDTSGMLNQFEFDKTPTYLGIIQAANAAGVTLYMFDATGLGVDPNVSAESRTRSTRLDTFTQRTNQQSMLQLMADETGGEAVLNRNVVTPDLQKIEKDFTSYYSLGYRSVRSGLDRPHKLEVKVKRKGLVVRARRSYVEKGLETRTVEAVMSGLFFSRDDNPLAAGLEVGQAIPNETGYFQVPVRIRIPYSRIAMLPEGPKVRGRLTFYFVVMDSSEKKSDLSTQTKQIELDAKRFEELQKKDFVYDVTLLMIPGGQRLSFAVRDDTTTTTSYIQKAVFVSVFSGETSRPR